MEKINLIIISVIVLVVVGVIIGVNLLNSGKRTMSKIDFCEVDDDCVPAQCCHPIDLVNKEFALDCSGIGCTAVCEGPLDCGCGEPVCINNECSIKKLSNESYCG